MFFNKKHKEENTSNLVKIAALLIHTAKIDQNYSIKEEEIIKKTLVSLGAEQSDLDNLITNASKSEENANQILDFTREIKNLEEMDKIKIVKSLWKIIYSNKDADIYETNLMRRLAGLLYIDNAVMGNIKEEIKKEYL
ncbi:TerB family tellurite resistance protein [Candidatus Pelagibacter bacterium]|nr:TerB family tellurite resistance protein [Candidatus Pelagibacter bacterium]